MESKYTCVSLILLLAIFSCTTNTQEKIDRFAHIEDDKARAIIKASVENAGGIDLWESIKTLKYTKDFSLLEADGSVEKSFSQVHDYSYDPTVIDIKSTENGSLIHTTLTDGKYDRTKDGEKVDVSTEALTKAVNTSTYVVGMPFKLLDPGAAIKYDGELTFNDAKVDVIEVSYNPAKNKNHSTADVWKYYFDKDDVKIVGNWVDAGDHSNVIENLTFERVGGILWNKKRKSWRLDSLGVKQYVRADYSYDNYEVNF